MFLYILSAGKIILKVIPMISLLFVIFVIAVVLNITILKEILKLHSYSYRPPCEQALRHVNLRDILPHLHAVDFS